MFINGKFVNSISGKTRKIINPATKKLIEEVPEAQPEDVALAVTAARAAFDNGDWKNKTAQDRQKLLFSLSQKIRDKFSFLAELEVKNMGKPIREAEFDIDDASNCFEFYAGLATKIHGETMSVPSNSFSYVVREPVGVCAQIIPWNYPFLMSAWKIAPALAAGCTVILKPSELTPLTAIELAKLIKECNFPDGVVNIITGDGANAGTTLISDKRIDKIAFTGGTETGKKIGTIAAQNLKKCTLELGGKNPVIFFDDADFDMALDWGLFAAFANSGQVCTAGSRFLIQENIFEKFKEMLLEGVKKIKMGNGLDRTVTMGPVISETHYNKIMSYIEIGKKEAKLICGGNGSSQKGFFIEPTIFSDVPENSKIAREEIFGPVLSLLKFKDEADAVRIANDTDYGLGFGIFTKDVSRAHRLTKQIKAGIGWVNYYHPTFNELPWGGYKQSGVGRELGLYGIENYLEVKQVNINLDATPIGWY